MKLIRVGVDLAKDVFQLHGVDRSGTAVWKRRLSRTKWLDVLLARTEPGCEIGMEACAGAHHWARELQTRGYTVRLMPPQFVNDCFRGVSFLRHDPVLLSVKNTNLEPGPVFSG